jgi:DNA-binding CsgD family transcriptional regulator
LHEASEEDLFEPLYEAIVDAKRWVTFFSRLCNAVGALSIGAIGFEVYGVEEGATGAAEIRYDRNASSPPGNGRPPRGRVHLQRRQNSDLADGAREFADRWREAATRGRIDHVLVVESPEGSIAACRHGEPFSGADRELFASILPHLVRALRLHVRFAEAAAVDRGATDVLDHLPFGVVLLDSRSRIVSRNRRAGELIEAEEGVKLVGDVLRAARSADADALSALLSSVCGTDGGRRSGGAVSLGRRGKRPLSLIATPLTDGHRDAFRHPVAMVVLADPDVAGEHPVNHVAQLYRLTPAEARIATLLTSGRTLEEVSDELGISLHTARTHLKRVLAKTDTTRQADLVRLILRVVPVNVPGQPRPRTA